MKDDDVWFEPKRFGYGAGLPVAWQGWALLGLYVAGIAGFTAWLRPHHPAPYYIVVAGATLAMAVIAARHTRGGWRWRR